MTVTFLLVIRQAVHRRHDFYLDYFMEQGRSTRSDKGTTQKGKTPLRFNTDDLLEVRLAHSSDEAFVMKVERRG
jgi:hypothetical protein